MSMNWRETEANLQRKDKIINKLLQELCDIQSACIGELTMGYKMDANSIGNKISETTEMTHPELVEHLKRGEK